MVLTLDRFGDEAPARRSSRDETSSSLQGRASRLQQLVSALHRATEATERRRTPASGGSPKSKR